MQKKKNNLSLICEIKLNTFINKNFPIVYFFKYLLSNPNPDC